MQLRTSDLVPKTSITNNLTTTSRTSGLTLDARQGQVLDAKISGLDTTKATITILTDPFAQFTAVQGQYYVFSDILFKRTGATISAQPSSDVYEGHTGWQYVLGARFFDGFIAYGDHTFNNDSRWVKYQKGVAGQRAVKGQIWYTDGKAYRYINSQSTNGIGIGITGDNELASDKTKWELFLYPTPTFTPTALKNSVTAGTYTNGEFQGSQPAGSVAGMKFCDQFFRYEYMNGMNDADGTTYVWVRNSKQ